eukprot:TRINITY_DN728_c0_g1_i2.p1 TRINITY_DN728_c0_g1~~TRINITY_DN728_c0_g1_i2.p1  ORF type:complete len:195 (-),score=56.47 TRINITY_DN728_c0_g1_i2:51-635(-)
MLGIACERGFLDIVKEILTEPNAKAADENDDPTYPFGSACSGGHVEIVKYLLQLEDVVEMIKAAEFELETGYFIKQTKEGKENLLESGKSVEGHDEIIKLLDSDPRFPNEKLAKIAEEDGEQGSEDKGEEDNGEGEEGSEAKEEEGNEGSEAKNEGQSLDDNSEGKSSPKTRKRKRESEDEVPEKSTKKAKQKK